MARKEVKYLSGFPDYISFKFALEKYALTYGLLRARITKYQINTKTRKQRKFIDEPTLKKSFVAPPSKMDGLKEQLAEQKLKEARLKNEETIHEIIEQEYANFYKESSFIFDGLKELPERLKLTNDQTLIWNDHLGQMMDRLQNLSEEH